MRQYHDLDLTDLRFLLCDAGPSGSAYSARSAWRLWWRTGGNWPSSCSRAIGNSTTGGS
jgi:hypothetical protein